MTTFDSAGEHDSNPKTLSALFSQRNTVAAWLEAEAALALAGERSGVLPLGVANRIVEACTVDAIDFERLQSDTDLVGFPIAPLVKQIVENCDDEAGKWVHWGSTTQDIVDTGLVLQARLALDEIERELARLIRAIEQLTTTHRETLMVGRTFQQHAAPITFGFKTSVWLDELLRHFERLVSLRARVLVGQCGGAVGTLASLGDHGLEVQRLMMDELGLEAPDVSWHPARDRWAELASWLAMLGATLGKMSSEVVLLMRTEVNEVREPFVPGRGVSSAMPQKRNPTVAPRVIAIAHRLREAVSSQLSAMIQDHERSAGPMTLEGMVIPEALTLVFEALEKTADVMMNLEVDAKRMRENLDADGGLLMAESVMMRVSEDVGRRRAMEIVSRAAHVATTDGITLREALLGDPDATVLLPSVEIDHLLDPENYLGSAAQMIDRVLSRAQSMLAERERNRCE